MVDEDLYLLLMDYAAGSLGKAAELAVATHLAMNSASRMLLAELSEAANCALDEMPIQQMADMVKARSFTNHSESEACVVSDAANRQPSLLPCPLRAYIIDDINTLAWQRLARGIERYVMPVADTASVQLMRMAAYRKIPAHTHAGLELAVILDGYLCEGKQVYQRGDIAIANMGQKHRPYTNSETCLCLVVTEGKLRFNGPLGPLYNRFMKARH